MKKIDRLDIKIKNVCLAKYTNKLMKRQTTGWERTFQHTFLTKDLYVGIKNSQNSIRNKHGQNI